MNRSASLLVNRVTARASRQGERRLGAAVQGHGGSAQVTPMRDAWTAATGNSAEHGRLVQSAVCPSDELAEPTGSGSDTIGRERDGHGHFAKGNRIAKAKRVRSGPRGALAMLEAKGDEAWRAAVRWGQRYGAHRRRELAQAHGGALSAGVGAIVESAASLMADARYWRAKAIATTDPELSRLSAQLMAQARGCERDAWELAAREAAARPRRDGLAALLASDDSEAAQ